MKMHSKSSILAVSLSSLMLVAIAHAQTPASPPNLVLNGSFESGVAILTSLLQVNAPNNTAITSWTVAGGSIDYIRTTWTAADGERSLDMGGYEPGSIFQDIGGLTVGGFYHLSFQMAGNPGDLPVVKQLRVALGTSYSQDFSFDGTGRTPTNMGWTDRGLDFVATDPSMRLRFTSLAPGWAGAALDDVQIVVVPEPTSFGLFALATGLAVLNRKRASSR